MFLFHHSLGMLESDLEQELVVLVMDHLSF